MGSHFFDGSSAKRYDIEPDVWPGGISFTTERGAIAWRYEDLIRLWDYRPAEHLAFTHRQHQDSRLIIEEPELIEAVRQNAPDLLDRRKERLRTMRIPALLLLGVLVVVGAIYFLIPPVTDTIARIVPWSFEERERPDLANIEKIFGKRCDAGPPNKVLKALTDRMVAASGFPHQIHVDVLNNKMSNAFALPGGQVVVMRGLIDHARSPGELAAVLAHEMGHIVNRDLTERWIRHNALSAASMIIFGADTTGSVGDSLFQTGLGLSFSRSDEAAADAYSVRLLNKMDLSAAGGADFFTRLEHAHNMPAFTSYLSTHPDSGDRAAYFRDHGTGHNQPMTPEQWLILKRICG